MTRTIENDLLNIFFEINETDDRENVHYEKQSTVSSKKNVPTTPAVNSFRHKTPSKTRLSPDRISTQPINKNTLTTNKFEKDKERRLDIQQRERINQSVLKYKEVSR